MEIYDITKLELAIRNDELTGKSEEQVADYLHQQMVPVLLTHLTAQPKPGNASVSCTASSNGGVSCTGSVSIKW